MQTHFPEFHSTLYEKDACVITASCLQTTRKCFRKTLCTTQPMYPFPYWFYVETEELEFLNMFKKISLSVAHVLYHFDIFYSDLDEFYITAS